MMKKRLLIALLLVLAVPAFAVFKEKDLTQTLRVLLYELKKDYNKVLNFNASSEQRIQQQHQELVDLVEDSNELSIMLYSQPQDYTFDLTYALHQVTRKYEDFQASRTPFDQIIANMQVELDRYSKLAQTLRNMPPVRINPSRVPQLESVLDSIDVSVDTLLNLPSFALEEGFKMDSLTTVYRDSCLVIAEAMVDHYMEAIQKVEEDSEYYADTDELLKEAYDYAQTRYAEVQRKVFLEGQGSYFKLLKNPGRYWKRAVSDARNKYAVTGGKDLPESGWRGPIVAAYSILMFFLLGLAILVANILVRLLMRWVKPLQKPYFKEHKGLIITLFGVLIFGLISITRDTSNREFQFIIMASGMLSEFAFMLGAILLSMLIRLDRQQTKAAVLAYLPTLILGFLVVFFRVIFVPNSILVFVFPPLVLLFTVWQFVVNLIKHGQLRREDRVILWLSCMVMAASTGLAWYGLVMSALLMLIWWFFQLTLLQAFTAVSLMLNRYYEKHVSKRIAKWRANNPEMPISSKKGAYIEVSWFHDMVKMCLVPILGIWSFPLAVSMAGKVFNLSVVAKDLFMRALIHVEGVVHLSLYKLVVVLSLFFLFRYLCYAVKGFYRSARIRSVIRKEGLIKETDVNVNLANNIISLICWGIYVIIAFVMLQIPMSAITIITTGLATGLGFAMKDVLNNFFYGVQLMGGRLRVGDTIECDGIRGKVESLSYQSTQVASEDGSIIAFTNTALFNKNFKNLTRNHQYEMISFLVGVKYGTDVEKARQVILDALKPLLIKDKYGRDIVDMKKGVAVRLREFGESSVDIQVLLYAAVEVHYSFAAQAREAIYNAFAANGIEIPFPQQDVYIKETPKADGGKKK
ncbi:MAG: mechanosensitive ion channel [Bacteroidales bacterium]|nr:mechanosensitive ion channel [Bacteroidales bacterium]